jgi:hypothetical protein
MGNASSGPRLDYYFLASPDATESEEKRRDRLESTLSKDNQVRSVEVHDVQASNISAGTKYTELISEMSALKADPVRYAVVCVDHRWLTPLLSDVFPDDWLLGGDRGRGDLRRPDKGLAFRLLFEGKADVVLLPVDTGSTGFVDGMIKEYDEYPGPRPFSVSKVPLGTVCHMNADSSGRRTRQSMPAAQPANCASYLHVTKTPGFQVPVVVGASNKRKRKPSETSEPRGDDVSGSVDSGKRPMHVKPPARPEIDTSRWVQDLRQDWVGGIVNRYDAELRNGQLNRFRKLATDWGYRSNAGKHDDYELQVKEYRMFQYNTDPIMRLLEQGYVYIGEDVNQMAKVCMANLDNDVTRESLPGYRLILRSYIAKAGDLFLKLINVVPVEKDGPLLVIMASFARALWLISESRDPEAMELYKLIHARTSKVVR